MSILNNKGVTAYTQFTDEKIEGAGHGDAMYTSRSNPLKPRKVTASLASVENGEFTLKITDEAGTVHLVSWTHTGALTAAQSNEAFAAAVNSKTSLRNVVRAVFNSGIGNFTLNYIHPGADYTEVATAPGSANFLLVVSQTAGGLRIPVGRFVVNDPDIEGAALLPDGLAAGTEVKGVTARGGRTVNSAARGIDAVEGYDPGALMSIVRKRKIAMRNVGGVAAVKGGPVFVVDATAGGQDLGQARSDADGSNTFELPLTLAHWDENVDAGAVGMVWLEM